jgi:hypothetical protein
VTVAAWLGRFAPAPGRSGLAATAGRVEVLVRLYLPAALLDAERGELALAEALDVLVGAYSGDFDLGAAGRWVDLLGAHGAPMSTEAGWVRIGDQLLRVHTITVPVIVDDLWTQEA